MRKFNLDWQKGYEEGLRVGIENENNRAIKLIEKHFIENDEGGTGYCQGCDWRNAYAVGFEKHLIDLIKGEQK